MEKLTKEQKQIIKNFEEAEARILEKLKKHMQDLSKDEDLRKQTLKEFNDSFNNKN